MTLRSQNRQRPRHCPRPAAPPRPGKEFDEHFSVNLQALNVANRRVMLDNSFTFGGTHFLNPREIFVQLRYRFHY